MKISKFVTTKVDSKEDAMKLLTEFLADNSVRQFSGFDEDNSEECPTCYEYSYSCKCDPCKECEEKPMYCECVAEEDKVDDYDDCLKEADSFAKRHGIPFCPELHKTVIDAISSDGRGIWNSSSAFC